MLGFRFEKFTPPPKGKGTFQQLLSIFLEIMQHTGGNVAEALNIMNELDRQYGITQDAYGMGNFIDDLQQEGFIAPNLDVPGQFDASPLAGKKIREKALEDIFGKLRKSRRGQHRTPHSGKGEEMGTELRKFEYGDDLSSIAMTESLRNAQMRESGAEFSLNQDDIEVREQEQTSQFSTVVMLDISHSMILYGEDRITPAKKVAMALADMIFKKYAKDTLDIIVFGDDAWQIEIKDLPYLEVGPYHTNTVAGLELAMDIFRRRKTTNKQIFMITDGKPTCIKEGIRYYKNSWGLDRKILNRTFNLAAQCRRQRIPITTFMIAQDPYLVNFVQEFTKINQGRAFYSSLKGLGDLVFEDFQKNRKGKK